MHGAGHRVVQIERQLQLPVPVVVERLDPHSVVGVDVARVNPRGCGWDVSEGAECGSDVVQHDVEVLAWAHAGLRMPEHVEHGSGSSFLQRGKGVVDLDLHRHRKELDEGTDDGLRGAARPMVNRHADRDRRGAVEPVEITRDDRGQGNGTRKVSAQEVEPVAEQCIEALLA